MKTDSVPARHPFIRTSIMKRWVALGIVSVLLHVLAINWASGNIRLPAIQDSSDTVITAALQPAQLAPPSAPPAPKSIPKPKVKPHRRPPATRPTLAPVPVESAPAALSEAIPEQAEATAEPVAIPSENESSAQAPQTNITEQAADTQQEQAGVHYKLNPPPSVELKYDVVKVPTEGNPMYGHGTISWQSNDNSYSIHGEAGVLFITALTFKSEGTIDSLGIAPVIYSEKRFRKSETNTHFQRGGNTISFSASTVSYPRKGGEQDRASIVWQIASIGRGDTEKFAPGADIDMFVAGVRDGEIWRIRVIGKEDIEVGAGKMTTWHVVRMPKPGSYDQKLDFWLAPQHEWYPVKLRYTETNGDYLDLSLSAMRVAEIH